MIGYTDVLDEDSTKKGLNPGQATKGKAGSKDDGLTPEQRRERDAKALQEKAAKKAAQAAAGGNPAGGDGGSKNKK
ncbi:hypothetical protein ES288_A08G128300v1 [Gossypium darwinii]|uniref:Small EDRK-rich factor-like N-terminal domain-containing protein n=1 Tax=Gossypium darwinii TaxID=34276 RepID=A0A5D2FKU0_GOSDA|nr:hypothetical protein ES288_A08G128300v1 [Gossypium darwinii]